MTRAHDMGGRFGYGAIRPEGEDEPLWHEPWHDRAMALTLAAGALGQWNIDMSRHARECLSVPDYSTFSYYEKWIAALADLLVETSVLTRDDLTGEGSEGRHALSYSVLTAEKVPAALAKGSPSDRPSFGSLDFAPGQEVRVRPHPENTHVEGGHTRLPAYAAGARGRILRHHGNHVLPDTSAHGLGDQAEPLYAVVFPASELWQMPEHPNDEVVLDLWQSYLEPA